MAEITAAMVKELREQTGAGMMDCKKALTKTNGNFEEAVEELKKSGAAKAVKKASRIAAEGITKVAKDGDKIAAVVEVNSETDFVAKNEKFQNYVEAVAKQALKSNAKNMDEFMAESWIDDASKSVNDVLVEMIAVIGEKLSIRRFEKVEAKNGFVVTYVHGGGKISVVVEAETANVNDASKEALVNIAMQIAAMNPQYIDKAEITSEELAKMREITIDSALNDPATLPKPILNKLIDEAVANKTWSEEDIAIYQKQKEENNLNNLFNFLSKAAIATLAQAALAGKEAYLAEKMFSGVVDGRVNKQIKEICLLEQAYVKDDKLSVAAYLKSVDPTLKIAKYVRYETGEGLEKKNEDFAAEVAAQLK